MNGKTAVAWSTGGVAVYFGILGIQNGLLVICSLFSFLIGSLAVCLYYGKIQSDATYGQAKVPLAPGSVGIPKLVAELDELGSQAKPTKLDRRLTGASNIDEQLQEVIDYVFRDYIEVWYKEISDDERFLLELRKIFNVAISNFASRAKDIDWTPFITQKLVDELASHVKLYRRADQKVKDECSRSSTQLEGHDNSQLYHTEGDREDMIEQYFFEFEMEMEGNICREPVTTDEENEKRYFQDVTEAILFFLLPDEIFDQRMFRFLIREVLVNGVIIPTINKMSHPDYVNQSIIWMNSDSALASDAFLTTVKLSRSIDEVQSILAKVNDEMSRVRAKDTGGVDDSSIKQTLSSLSYLKRVCETQITRLALSSSGTGDCVDAADGLHDLTLKPETTKDLPFMFVLTNDLGIQYFNDYLITNDKEVYLNILFDIEFYNRRDLGQGDKQEVQGISMTIISDIYDKYFAESIPNLQIEAACIEPIIHSLREGKVSSSVFDALHDAVMEKLGRLYEEFKKHSLYVKMVGDLDLDIGSSFSDESEDACSMTGSKTETGKADTKITAKIIKTVWIYPLLVQLTKKSLHVTVEPESGIVKDKGSGGKTYAVYSIQVIELTLSTGSTVKWLTTRRYSDFYDLYVILCDKFSSLRGLPFPEKRAFNNTSKGFLEKRANSLMLYLQLVLESEAYGQNSSLKQIMYDFLNKDSWNKPKTAGHKKVGALFKQMGSKVANLGDAIDGFSFSKMFNKVQFSLTPTLAKNQLDSYKVGATLDVEDDDNIPMRIMLLLLDEVFDLRKKNQWLRRRIIAILRQILKATHGDKINRRIVDHVEMLTSADQVAEYIKQMKDKLWPSGIPAEPSSLRDRETQLRTAMVCKAKMIGSVPDELRHLIGTETTRAGVLRLFTMCQHQRLNKRLIFVIIEGVIQTLFPHSNFDKVFRQIHSRSQRGRADSSLSQCST